MEACASAHHWARELIALGHEVRLMPPVYVKRGKTHAADAEAICEAVTRPTMRFVAVKTVEQQAVLMLHKSRDLMVRKRTMLINALRGHLAEYGIVTGIGADGLTAMLKALHERQEELPAHARSALHWLAAQLRALTSKIDRLEAQILAWHRADETNRRLPTIPGIGPITASAILAGVADASLFRSGRQFAAWLGLTPRANSSGGKERLSRITKQGGGYLRRLLVVSATAVMRMTRKTLIGSRGWPSSWSASPRKSRQSRSPTKQRASLGRLCRAKKSTRPQPRDRHPRCRVTQGSRMAQESLSSYDKPVRPGGGKTQGGTALRAR
jgi:transposase